MDASLAGLVNTGRITMALAESRSSQPVEMRRLAQGMLATPMAA
jgi:twitching motility protein PilT